MLSLNWWNKKQKKHYFSVFFCICLCILWKKHIFVLILWYFHIMLICLLNVIVAIFVFGMILKAYFDLLSLLFAMNCWKEEEKKVDKWKGIHFSELWKEMCVLVVFHVFLWFNFTTPSSTLKDDSPGTFIKKGKKGLFPIPKLNISHNFCNFGC